MESRFFYFRLIFFDIRGGLVVNFEYFLRDFGVGIVWFGEGRGRVVEY